MLGERFSLSLLLSPLPTDAAATVFQLASCIPASLAAPVLRELAVKNYGLQLSTQNADNVIWKLEHYLPAVFNTPSVSASLPPLLKSFQSLAPSATLVEVHNRRQTCPFCPDTPQLKARECVSQAVVPNNLPRHKSLHEHRFRVYSLDAGVQYASFQEASCPSCNRFYINNWCFRKGQARFGHIADAQYLYKDALSTGLFVIPKYRSYFAVELTLLQHVSDTLHFAAGSLRSAVLLWAKRHSEHFQHSLIFGEDFTLLPHVEDDILMAWYTWNAVRLSGILPRQLTWNFQSGFDESLQSHVPLIHQLHMDRVAEHMKLCPHCSNSPLLVLDGKHGARRMICAGLQGTQQYASLGVTFDTGCTNFAPPGQLHCKRCRQQTDVQQSLLKDFEKRLLVKRTDHRNLRSRPMQVKGPRRTAKWLKPRYECAKAKAKPQKTTFRCPVDKEYSEPSKRRKTTGGILTCVTSCGYMADFVEMWRGEQLELVYAFSLSFLKDMTQRGVVVRCLAYDNACHLLQKARENRHVAGDISRSFASDLAIVLDNFHRDNHKWCLQHLPEVDPKHPDNTGLLAGKNTQACEQLNSWITHRTKSSLDMPPGRFQVFWWTILLEHNAWIQEEAAAARRRAARRAKDPSSPSVPGTLEL
ncbi:unnamed protein product [Symbiodinium sp. CCMP2456]|nr:unnamed protein product [Symbiodinium sp. CCMP2456]